ncbi:MAG TPA: glycosyltransferase family 2 protein [Herpetosiphonaceae bacterium]
MSATLDVQPAAVANGANPWPFALSIVIPAFNEGHKIGEIVGRIRRDYPYAELIVVDDHSSDDTADQAERAGAAVIRRPYNIGNGAGVKTGVRAASGEVVVIIDGDGQHDPADIGRLLALIGPYDMVIGARSRSGQQNWIRWLGNAAINRLGSYLTGMEMKDLTSGFRAFRRPILMHYLHLLPNQYSWPTTSALAFAKGGYHVRFEPIEMRRRQGGQSHQKLFKNGFKFATIIFRIVSLFNPLRVFAPVSGLFLLLSLVSYLLSVANNGGVFHMPPTAMLAFISALFFFMFGLLAEMIAALRLERYRD